MGGYLSKKVGYHVPVPEMTFKLNRLSGNGHRYQEFVASVSMKSGKFGERNVTLRTRKCVVTVEGYDRSTLVTLLQESLAEALADGTVSVAANYRPYSKHPDAFTLKNIKELMEIAADNINILVKVDKLKLEPCTIK